MIDRCVAAFGIWWREGETIYLRCWRCRRVNIIRDDDIKVTGQIDIGIACGNNGCTANLNLILMGFGIFHGGRK